MIGIIFVHVCVQKGDEWCHSNSNVDLVNANRQMLEILHIRIAGDWINIHTHTEWEGECIRVQVGPSPSP